MYKLQQERSNHINFLKRINRSVSYVGYLLIAIASNGFFAIYLPDNNPGTPRIAWFILAIIGGIIIGFKTLRFPQKKRLKIIVYDLIYTLILISFALFSLPFGINFILGSIIAILFLYYQIDQKILIQLN